MDVIYECFDFIIIFGFPIPSDAPAVPDVAVPMWRRPPSGKVRKKNIADSNFLW